MRRLITLIIVCFSVLGVVGFSWAMGMSCGEKMQTAQAQEATTSVQEEKAIEVGNKICPVSGEKIDEKLKATYEYKGKIYNFCCAMCIEEFKKYPEKYIKKVEEELQAQTGEQTTQESKMPMGTHEGHQH